MSTDLVKETDENGDVITHEVIRSEVNFLVFPFFALWNNDVSKKTKAVYKTVIQRNDKRVEIEWKVTCNPEYGYPGPLAKNLHKVVEAKISQLTFPIENPICIGILSKLAEKMDIKTRGGMLYEDIKNAFQTIVTSTIQSKGSFYSKGDEKYIDDTFHLYDRIVFRGEKLRSGEIAEENYVYLGSWYLDNINARYVKPIDYDYYQLLSFPIASRLYEILSVKFYGLLEAGGKFIRYRYSTLCDLLPVRRQKYKSWAERNFEPSHKKLVDTGFLSGFSWEKIKGVKGDWYLYYFPGSRAKAEIEMYASRGKKNRREFDKQKPNKLISPRNDVTCLRAPHRQAVTDEQDKDDEVDEISGDLVYELKKRKVSKTVAKRLVDFYSADYIVKKIEMFDYLRNAGKTFKNSAGWLKSSIEDDYEIDDFEELCSEKKFAEYAEETRKQRISEALSNFPDKEDWIQQRVNRAVADRNEMVKNMEGKHFYTDEEIEEMRKEYRENYPENEDEKREWLERQPEYLLNSIEKELMKEEKEENK